MLNKSLIVRTDRLAELKLYPVFIVYYFLVSQVVHEKYTLSLKTFGGQIYPTDMITFFLIFLFLYKFLLPKAIHQSESLNIPDVLLPLILFIIYMNYSLWVGMKSEASYDFRYFFLREQRHFFPFYIIVAFLFLFQTCHFRNAAIKCGSVVGLIISLLFILDAAHLLPAAVNSLTDGQYLFSRHISGQRARGLEIGLVFYGIFFAATKLISSNKKRFILIILTAVMIIAVLITYARVYYIGGLFMIIMMYTVGNYTGYVKMKAGTIVKLVSIAVIVVVIVGILSSEVLFLKNIGNHTASGFSEFIERKGSFASRLLEAEYAIKEVVDDNMFLGTGYGRIMRRALQNDTRTGGYTSYVHMIAVDFFYKFGLVGCFIFVWLVFRYYRACIRHIRLCHNRERPMTGIFLAGFTFTSFILLVSLMSNHMFYFSWTAAFALSFATSYLETLQRNVTYRMVGKD